mgnify:CR=1 FL=1
MKNLAVTKQVQDALTPNGVLQDLLEGNDRFVNGKPQAVDNSALVSQTTTGQFPKAVVLSCIDSRVPVETVLDQAIGDVFVARVAGNFENVDILGSLEYSCKVAGSKLILVLGHESCGAVGAAIDGGDNGHNLNHLLAHITPALCAAKEGDSKNDIVKSNAKLNARDLYDRSSIISNAVDGKELTIWSAYYNLDSGRVDFI